MYKGARYLLKEKIRVGKTGEELEQDDITTSIPEWEAKARPEFEPVYEGKQHDEINKRLKAKGDDK